MDLSKILLAIYHTGFVDVGQRVISLANDCFYTVLAKTPEELFREEWNRIRNNPQELRLYKKNEAKIRGGQLDQLDITCHNLLFLLVSERLHRDGKNIEPALEDDIKLVVTLRNNTFHSNIQTIEDVKRRSPTLASVTDVMVKDELQKIKDLHQINIFGKLRIYLRRYTKVFPEHKADDILIRLAWLIKSVDIPDYWVHNIKEFETLITELKANKVQQEKITQAMKQCSIDIQANNIKLKQTNQTQKTIALAMKQESNNLKANNKKMKQETQQFVQAMKQITDDLQAQNVKLEQTTQTIQANMKSTQDSTSQVICSEQQPNHEPAITPTQRVYTGTFVADGDCSQSTDSTSEITVGAKRKFEEVSQSCSEQQPNQVQTATLIPRVYTGCFVAEGDCSQFTDPTSEMTMGAKRKFEDVLKTMGLKLTKSSGKKVTFTVTALTDGSIVVHFQVITTEEDDKTAMELIKKIIRESGLMAKGLDDSSIKVKAIAQSDPRPPESEAGSTETEMKDIYKSPKDPLEVGVGVPSDASAIITGSLSSSQSASYSGSVGHTAIPKDPCELDQSDKDEKRLLNMNTIDTTSTRSTKSTFEDRLQSLKVQHAVVQAGQKTIWLVFTTLFLGDLGDIKGFVLSHLGSNRQYKRSFTKPEQKNLEEGNHSNWNITLIFKLLQKVCGLKENVSDWKRFGRDTLEKLLDELKDLRNDMAYNFDCVLSIIERDEKLEELRNLCLEILTKLNDKRQIGNDAVHGHFESIGSILNDVKKPINETPRSPYAAAATAVFPIPESYYSHDGAEGMEVDDSYENTSGEYSIINQLVKSFWKFAGEGFIDV